MGDPRVAVIGLCFQVMEADGAVRSSDAARCASSSRRHYKLDMPLSNALVGGRESAESEAIDFYQFTSDIKRHLPEEQRIELVGMPVGNRLRGPARAARWKIT